MLNVIMLSAVISSVVMLNAVALVSYACHIFLLLCRVRLSVVILNAAVLSVVASSQNRQMLEL